MMHEFPSSEDSKQNHVRIKLHIYEPFPSYRRILTPLQETYFEKTLCHSIIIFRDFLYFANDVFKVICSGCCVLGKGQGLKLELNRGIAIL